MRVANQASNQDTFTTTQIHRQTSDIYIYIHIYAAILIELCQLARTTSSNMHTGSCNAPVLMPCQTLDL